MSDVTYSQSRIERLSEIVSLNYSVFDGMYDRSPYNLEDYQKKLKNVDPIIYIAEQGGQIIGDSIAFARDNNWYLWIFGVSKNHRRQGIASNLFKLQEKYAKEKGYQKVTMKVYNVSKDMLLVAIKRGYEIADIEKKDGPEHNAIYLELVV
ncbi:GNAT family N-acetyltransferase [Candidatus Parcubacteria bacterium]|nr:GNAT family N-acetyltransferase [Candidatus Parcubacteria bacterium]